MSHEDYAREIKADAIAEHMFNLWLETNPIVPRTVNATSASAARAAFAMFNTVERNHLAAKAGQRVPSDKTWRRACTKFETRVNDYVRGREDAPDPFSGLAEAERTRGGL